MKDLTPENKNCQLEPEVFTTWADNWLKSDELAGKFSSGGVRFPSGPSQDVEDMLHGKSYYDPADIKMPVLVARGEWDKYPNNEDGERLFAALDNASNKSTLLSKREPM